MPRKHTGTAFFCDKCDWTFHRRFELKRHQAIHSPDIDELKINCSYKDCDYRTLQRSNLKTHITAVHLREKPHQCQVDDCKKAFADGASLIRHKNKFHFRKTWKLSSDMTLAKERDHPFVNTKTNTVDCSVEDASGSHLAPSSRPPSSQNPDSKRSPSPLFPSPMSSVRSLPSPSISESHVPDGSSYNIKGVSVCSPVNATPNRSLPVPHHYADSGTGSHQLSHIM
ncbi:hypothetical protein EW145_g5782 [Phellinidium pouzarii]|uniref:C2H2-type domain-containing protein n=1 Tax=Phellinidium pouzarii TaxID=167371 RepID=A0A4S4L3K5_9AGAM|nr:hypothetical protein EW145_g5782 [Phellinidium pouzarii]